MITNEMILASAGSGKTYQLTNRYIGLMALQLRSGEEVTPERIIAVTFTRKAAGEFFDSILAKIAKAAASPDTTPNSSDGDIVSESLAILTPEQYTQLLRIFISKMPRLFLGTLDSFYSNVLRSFPGEFGLTGDFEIIDQHLESLAKKDVYRSVFQPRFSRGEGGDQAQREFLEAFRQATFGKEESKILRELDQFVSNLHALYLEAPSGNRWGEAQAIWPGGCDFLGSKTNLKKDFDKLFSLFRESDDPEGGKDAKTRVDWKFWEQYRDEAPLHKPGAKLTTRIAYMFNNLLPHWADFKAGHATVKINRKSHEFGPKECEIVLRILRHLAGGEIEARLKRTHGVWQLLDRYEKTYADRIRRQGKLTFQDLALLLAGTDSNPGSRPAEGRPAEGRPPMLSQMPGEDERLRIDYRLDARYDHWMLDEFQDTSFLQWKVIANLIDETVQDTSGERSLFQVGDSKQSIYAWRGGDPTLFRDISDRYNHHETRVQKRNLDESWRSGNDIIDTVNQVFGVPKVFAELGLPQEAIDRWEWHDHKVCQDNQSLAGYTAMLNPVPPEGEKAELEDRFDITLAILEEMQPIERGIECAILVQTNKIGRQIVNYLRTESDIPVMCEADIPVATDNALNRAILSYLKLAAHPGDSFSWEHLRMTPFSKVIAEDSLTSAMLSSRVRMEVFEFGFETVVRNFIRTLAQTAELELDDFSIHRGEELALSARLFDETGTRDIDEFLSYARNRTVREPDAKSAVQVMTIHKSKGLTFDAVILPDLEGNALTTVRNDIGAKKNSAREVEWVLDLPKKEIYQADDVLRAYHADRETDAAYENLCKLYVAMTRARCANYLITQPRSPKATSSNFVKLLETALVSDDAKEGSIGDLPVSILFETNLSTTDRHWFSNRSLATPETESIAEAREPLPDTLARLRPARRTPSGSETGVVTAAQLFSPDSGRTKALGTMVHAMFEEIEWADPSTLEAIHSNWVNRTGLDPGMIDSALEQVRNSLQSKEIVEALTLPAEPCELWREKSFEIVLNDEWLSGTFDRVVIIRDASGSPSSATIIDFKTNQAESEEEVANLIEKYSPQLITYREVLARMTGLPESAIRTLLLFTRAARIEDCPA